jgi:hypothetical protein
MFSWGQGQNLLDTQMSFSCFDEKNLNESLAEKLVWKMKNFIIWI